MISSRVRNLKESSTLRVNALVNRMKAEGKEVFNLTAGEPDFPPSEAAKNAVLEAVAKNQSKYTPTAGIPELRELIAKKTNSQQSAISVSRPWRASDVVVTNGGKQAIFNAIFALVDSGDEVVFGAPFWLSYPEMVKAAGGTSVVIETRAETGYRIQPEQLERAISEKTKLLILNSPSNPTGSVYAKDDLRALGEILKKHPTVWVLSDEIYDRIEFVKGVWVSFLDANPELRDRTVTVNGLSKSGAMTGWRVGWSITPESLTPALISLQGHSTSGICSLSQAAAIASLKLSHSDFEPQRLEYLNRRNLALEVLRKSAKIKAYEPAGAFYLFVDCGALLKDDQDANGLAERVLQEAKVAVVSGVDFGAPKCIRISFATDPSTLREGCERLVRFFDSM
ncbi:MAG: pyridoxal phosphate-dependent aminotransferase [Bdellovibrionales bacterium]|nr:pyridoxal phosphate-dependent aminotransferase [Bdellovibrionales bacterium]